MKKGILMFLILMLFPAPGLADFSAGDPAMVLTRNDRLNLRSEPNTQAVVLTRLSSGTQVIIVDKQGEWYQVDSGAYTGYVHGDYLRSPILSDGSTLPTDPGCCLEGKVAYVSTQKGDLRLRSGPGTEASIVGSLSNASPVILSSQCGNWFKVKSLRGSGYVHCAYLSSTPSESPPPHIFLYSAPEEGAPALELVSSADKLYVQESGNVWSQVRILGTKQTGYVRSAFLADTP